MKDYLAKLESADYAKGFKRLLIVTLAAFVAACALNAFMFRTQISEVVSLEKQHVTYSQQSEYQLDNKAATPSANDPALNAKNAQAANGTLSSKDAAQAIKDSKLSNGGALYAKDAREHDGHDGEFDFLEGSITPPGVGALVVLGLSVLAGALCVLVYWLMVAAWLYKAASKAGMNRALWSILGLMFNLLAVFLFLIMRGRRMKCPVCGTWQEYGGFCRQCGASLEIVCSKCGNICSSSDVYCGNCGAEIKADEVKEAEFSNVE